MGRSRRRVKTYVMPAHARGNIDIRRIWADALRVIVPSVSMIAHGDEPCADSAPSRTGQHSAVHASLHLDHFFLLNVVRTTCSLHREYYLPAQRVAEGVL